jgi:hypothetical protein
MMLSAPDDAFMSGAEMSFFPMKMMIFLELQLAVIGDFCFSGNEDCTDSAGRILSFDGANRRKTKSLTDVWLSGNLQPWGTSLFRS